MGPAKSVLALLCLVTLTGLCGCEAFSSHTASKAPEPEVPHFDKAVAFEKQGAFDQAAVEYRAAIRERPDDSRPYVNLGRLHARAGQPEAAEAYWLKAAEINPRDAQAYNLLGGSCMRNRDYNKAVDWYKKALEIDPNDAAVHWNAAIAYRSLKMDRDAATHYRQYLELAGTSEPADAAEARKFISQVRADE